MEVNIADLKTIFVEEAAKNASEIFDLKLQLLALQKEKDKNNDKGEI